MTVQFVFRNKRKAGVVSEESIVILSDDECENPKKAEYEQVKFSTPPAVSPVTSILHCDPNDTKGKMRKVIKNSGLRKINVIQHHYLQIITTGKIH